MKLQSPRRLYVPLVSTGFESCLTKFCLSGTGTSFCFVFWGLFFASAGDFSVNVGIRARVNDFVTQMRQRLTSEFFVRLVRRARE